LDGVVELLAHDNSGAHHVDTDTVRTVDHVMITSTVFGFFLTIVGMNETTVTGYKILTTANNINEKTEKKEWKASLHEEVQQILKDVIREAGK
jgi:hypothetical protein